MKTSLRIYQLAHSSRRKILHQRKIFGKCSFGETFRSMTSKTRTQKFADVIISGGGMVGTALACALGKIDLFQNRHIMVLEANANYSRKNWSSELYENRVSAITPGSKTFLEDIGVWEKISKRRLNQFTDMYVWDNDASVSFKAKEVGMKYMAYMIENGVIVESCTECVAEMGNIYIQYNSKIRDVKQSNIKAEQGYGEDLVEVTLQNGETIRTKLLVGADGLESFVRSKAKLTTYEYDYGQMAVVAILKIDSKGKGNFTAWQKYSTTGPIALLPMTDTLSSLVWSTSYDQAKRLVVLPEEEFIKELNQVYQEECSINMQFKQTKQFLKLALSTLQPGVAASNKKIRPPEILECQANSRGIFPLKLKHATHYVNSRIALVGDAAHRIHPMAGQGVNLGFGDASCLTQSIETSLKNGKDFGVLQNLISYETERQCHVVAVIAAINSLNFIFSSELSSLAFARLFGLGFTNSLIPLKKRIVSFAMM